MTSPIKYMRDSHFSKGLLTGNKDIDDQHRELFALVHDLKLDVQLGNSEKIKDTFATFLDYVINHFTFEEMLMYRVDYPKESLEKHRLAHRTLQEIYLVSYKPVLTGDLPAQAILELFESYFMNHLLEEDHKLAQYINARTEESPDKMADILASLRYTE